MTREQIAELRKLEAAASPGPWKWGDAYDFHEHAAHVASGLDAECSNVRDGHVVLRGAGKELLGPWAENAGDSGLQAEIADLRLLEAARNALPRLLDEREALLEAAKVANAAMDALEHWSQMDAETRLAVAIAKAESP
jgi:hypothetical protein